jgi:NAD(P)-dependent dehydrogenase (short-subunit alcohol dehydrogenase family)
MVGLGQPKERWSPPDLSAVVACVAGASFGVGRGIAEVLGECGATVYVTGRSTRERPSRPEGWSVDETAELVRARGGVGVPVALDHTTEEEVADLMARIDRDHGRLDLLVNGVWQWGPPDSYLAPSWEQPVERWDAMFGVGVRSLFVTSRNALPLMIRRQRGLVVATQERPGDDQHFGQNVVVDVAAVAMERIVRYLARELEGTGVAALLVYLGWVRSVNMGMGFDAAAAGMSQEELMTLTQSASFVGRAIAVLAADPAVIRRSGSTLYAGDVAREYGFTDVDGRIPPYKGGE